MSEPSPEAKQSAEDWAAPVEITSFREAFAYGYDAATAKSETRCGELEAQHRLDLAEIRRQHQQEANEWKTDEEAIDQARAPLVADKERLDWLEGEIYRTGDVQLVRVFSQISVKCMRGKTLREAIDAALTGTGKKV